MHNINFETTHKDFIQNTYTFNMIKMLNNHLNEIIIKFVIELYIINNGNVYKYKGSCIKNMLNKNNSFMTVDYINSLNDKETSSLNKQKDFLITMVSGLGKDHFKREFIEYDKYVELKNISDKLNQSIPKNNYKYIKVKL